MRMRLIVTTVRNSGKVRRVAVSLPLISALLEPDGEFEHGKYFVASYIANDPPQRPWTGRQSQRDLNELAAELLLKRQQREAAET